MRAGVRNFSSMHSIDAFFEPSFFGLDLFLVSLSAYFFLLFAFSLYFQLLQHRSYRRKHSNLTVGNVSDAAQEAVLLVVGGDPVEADSRQRQDLVRLLGRYDAFVPQVLENAGRIADINAAYLRTYSHQDHALPLVEREFQVAGQCSQRLGRASLRLIDRSIRWRHVGTPSPI